MPTIPETLQTALQHHRAGRLQEAEALYRRILESQPDHPDALHALGLIAHQVGRHEAAVDLIGRAIAGDPTAPEFHTGIGEAYRALGRLEDAIASYSRALALNPGFAEAHYNLGLLNSHMGRLDDAEACYRRALAANQASAEAHNNLGNVLKERGKNEEAVVHYRQALALKPDFAEAHNNLGVVLQEQGKVEAAAACYRQAQALKPDYVEAMNNLGGALTEQSRPEEAVAQHRQALALTQTHAGVHNNLGVALQAQGKVEEAIACYRQAVSVQPDHADAHSNLGNALKEQGKLGEAVDHCRQAVALKPNFAKAHNNLGTVLQDQGKPDEAIACYRQALSLKPDYAEAHSNMLFAMHYDFSLTSAIIAAEHAAWNDRHACQPAATNRVYMNVRDPDRRLRVGYVSGDYHRHSVMYFFEPLLAAHDRARVEVFCYSAGVWSDEVSNRLRAGADAWRPIAGMSDDAVAELIREDRIDILVDLSGHTAHNRLFVFARKPAPVQVTYLGYGSTTGLSAMDYRLTDQYLSPSGGPEWFSEELVRLPGCYVCYRPPAEAPPVAPAPVAKNGFVTFGSFNNLAKVTPEVVSLWAEILRALPQAWLVLKDRTLDDATQRARFRSLFAAEGIAAERIDLVPKVAGLSEHLASYERVDVGLDPFPYNGCTTTCEALWMGVPVITLAGNMSHGRYGVSLLTAVELEDLIAATPSEYVVKSVSLAKDLKRLAALRSTLRRRMAAAALCDAKAFSQKVEQAYRLMWRRWCRQP